MANYGQPQLVTGSISSAIGMGGGTTPQAVSDDASIASGGRFTGGVRFNDPALQTAFSNPLTPEDYAGFQVDLGPGVGAENTYDPWGRNLAYTPQLVDLQSKEALDRLREEYGWTSSSALPGYMTDARTSSYGTDEWGNSIAPPYDPPLSIYYGGKQVADPNALSDADRMRAYTALSDPEKANVFDLGAHPLYGEMRSKWYESPNAMGQKYGFGPKFGNLMSIEEQYKTQGAGYIPMDFYADAISDKLKTANAATYGNVQLANDILSGWMQQPALHGQYTSTDQFPSLWGGVPNTQAVGRERAYIAEELTEDQDGGLFGGGFLGDLLSFAAPLLSFIPGLQPLGWALGMMNAVASGNPLSILASLAGPVMSSMSSGVSGFSGVGDLGGGLTAPSSAFSFDFSPEAMGPGFNAGGAGSAVSGGFGLTPPADWGLSGFGSIPSLGAGLTLPSGFSPGDLGTGLTPPSGFSLENLGVPSSSSLMSPKMVSSAAKGALKLASRGMEGSQQPEMLRHRNVQPVAKQDEKPVFAMPLPQEPAAVRAPGAMEERWRRLRGQTVIPGPTY